MKILVMGPRGVGKTTFVQKMFPSRDMIRSNILESDSDSVLSVDAKEILHSYLILPEYEKLKNRCPSLNIEEEIEKWTQFFYNHFKDYTMTWVADF